MCRFDMPPNRTNHKKGAKTVRIKTTRAEKKGFTVALAATAAGENLPAVVVFKERGGVLGERVRWSLHVPANVRVRATTNGWMTAEEYHHWLQHVYGREVEQRLLVVDIYRPHQTVASINFAKRECNTDVIVIPDSCTSIAQPMDKCINNPFKEAMRACWEEWMRGDRQKTLMRNLKQPTRQEVLTWVSKAWGSIKQETLVRSFLVCGISNALDGSEDDLPSVLSAEVESDDGECSDNGSDADGLGDPFSDDSDSDCLKVLSNGHVVRT